MIQSLRAKLALSHLIPTLLLLPMLSLYLLYTLEDFYTESLLHQLVNQSHLVRSELEQDPELFDDTSSTRQLARVLALLTDSRILLLDSEATILASTRTEDDGRLGTRYEHPSVTQALLGQTASGVGPGFSTDVAYVVLPLRKDGSVIGAVRMSYEVNDVRAQFEQLRWLVVGGVLLTVVLALGLALGLATTITRPLSLLRDGVQRIAAGNYRARVAVRGRDEVGVLAQTFNQMAERLEEAVQARERQLAAIVHELARPLAGMRVAVETLRDGADADSDARDVLLAGVESELGRLERLIKTLQGLHQRALNPIQLNRSWLDLERVIRASAANFEHVSTRQGISLTVNLPPDLPKIRADDDRLIQVLTNLLDNAFKFTPRGGSVTVEARDIGANVSVSVADNGVGIAPEELPHVFQQFYSGGELRPPEKRGMGLGLAICREIVAAHRGKIEVESNPGKGARFTFFLPKQ